MRDPHTDVIGSAIVEAQGIVRFDPDYGTGQSGDMFPREDGGYVLYGDHAAAIESLQKQLANERDDNRDLRLINNELENSNIARGFYLHSCNEKIAALTQRLTERDEQLAESQNENIEQARLLGMSAEREIGFRQQLAERDEQLREANERIAQYDRRIVAIGGVAMDSVSRDAYAQLKDAYKSACNGRRDFRAAYKTVRKLLTAAQAELAETMEIVKAVAHIGIDFGYGKFQLEDAHIAQARRLYDAALAKQEKRDGNR